MLYDDKRWKMPEIPAPAPPEVKAKPKKVQKKLEPWQETLLKAAALIKEKGWCCRSYHNDNGKYCAVGAINKVLGFNTGYPTLLCYGGSLDRQQIEHQVVLAKLATHIGIPLFDIENWNDEHRRGAEVIKAMEEAARND